MNPRVAFLGCGAIAKSHAFALVSQPFYYPNACQPSFQYVASPTESHRIAFAQRYGIPTALAPDELWQREDYDTLVIAGPNRIHCEQLVRAAQCDHIKRIYIEKPVCCSRNELATLRKLCDGALAGKTVQVGFQFLHYSGLRRALGYLREGALGRPLHFRAEYLHSGYLNQGYRSKRQERLKGWPVGGALADLGCHALSILVAALGDQLSVQSAMRSGSFEDVRHDTDLCTQLTLRDEASGALGSLVASRVSAGAGDDLSFEVRCERGAIRFSSQQPNRCWVNQSLSGDWESILCASDYHPDSNFPSPSATAGFLRPLIHAHFLFLGDDPTEHGADLDHGLVVQKLVLDAYERLTESESNGGRERK